MSNFKLCNKFNNTEKKSLENFEEALNYKLNHLYIDRACLQPPHTVKKVYRFSRSQPGCH
jgi:hypothetical protein